MKTSLCIAGLLGCAIAALPQVALAHAIETDYHFLTLPNAGANTTVNSPILLTSQYSTGEPLVNAEVEIYAPNNWDEPWQVGTTDAHGQFAFVPDATTAGNWEVMIRQEGHGELLSIPISDQGVNLEQITQKSQQDHHYGAAPWSAIATLGALGIGIYVGRTTRRSA